MVPTGVRIRTQALPVDKLKTKDQKKASTGWLSNTGSNVSNVVLSGSPRGLPDRETIIIILIRTCPTLLQKNAFDSHWKVNDVERDIYPKRTKE